MRIGVILAGGESKRFHGNKLLAKVDGVPVIKKVYDALKCCIDQIYLSVRDEKRARELSSIFGEDVGYIMDYEDIGGGPYSAIISSIDKIESDEIILVPGDTPWINSKFFERWFNLIDEYKTASSTVIWGNGMLDSLYQYVDKRRLRNIIKLLYLMRKSGRATDILRASPCVLFAHVKNLVDDPVWLAHVNTRDNLINPNPKNPLYGIVNDNIILRRGGISSIPFLRALDRISSRDYHEGLEIFIGEMSEYFKLKIYHLVYHVARDIGELIECLM